MPIAHKIQLRPSQTQEDYFRQACGTSRFVWNWALAEWNKQYQAGLKPNAMLLKKQFNAVKYQQFPWMAEIHRDAHAAPFSNLGKAFSAFFHKKARYPKFKKKSIHDSFEVANDKMEVDEKKVHLPVIGWVRMHEALRFEGKILIATVSRIADRWFISITVDALPKIHSKTGDAILGVDLGISTSMTISDGRKLEGPKSLAKNLRRLRRLSGQLSRKKKGSRNRQKAKDRLAKLYWRIGNQRMDFLHKATTMLCRESQAIGIEDLAVGNMMKNHRLARNISNEAFAEARRLFEYKTKAYGVRLNVADRWYPSSKTCSFCGAIKADLKLSDRVFHCDSCGSIVDRDVNASRNLASLCTVGYAGNHACGQTSSTSKDFNFGATGLVEAGTKCEQECLQER
jgi:putative transposase